MTTKYLTGIKPTGQLHLGSYVSTIKPIIEILQKEENTDVYFFIADQHALTTQPSPVHLVNDIQKMMVGLFSIFNSIKIHTTNNLYIYRQSKIPAIFEFYWMLSCFTAKGFLNRNHSYKQETEKNVSRKKDPDKGIFMGLYNYPILMAADILLFDIDYVPVGKDQLQHLEISNEISRKMNHIYNYDVLKQVNPIIQDNVLLPGTDGNKMSKSYDNTVKIFQNEKTLKNYIFKMKTNFKEEGDPKYPDESEISMVYKLFSTEKEYFEFKRDMIRGKSWKDLKTIVYEKLRNEIKIYQDMYYLNISKNDKIEQEFNKNERIVNKMANSELNRIKSLCGLGGE